MPAWTELPLLLMDKIMRQLQTHDLVQLRLVCKSWKAACTEFGGSAVGYIQHQQEMLDCCSSLPNLSTVELKNTAADFSLSPLAACSNLEDVALHHRAVSAIEAPAPTLDFGCLPVSVRRLSVSCFDFDRCELFTRRGSFTSLTSLEMSWRIGENYVVPTWREQMVDMPNLKVDWLLYALLLPPCFNHVPGQRPNPKPLILCSNAEVMKASAKYSDENILSFQELRMKAIIADDFYPPVNVGRLPEYDLLLRFIFAH